jgi:GT2 family glycosyltransferase
LKWWRYRGVYYGHSGIFIRKEAFESIGGFQFDTPLADYDFVKRMEKHGPTLYLHQYIIAPAPRYHYALIWLIAPIFR